MTYNVFGGTLNLAQSLNRQTDKRTDCLIARTVRCRGKISLYCFRCKYCTHNSKSDLQLADRDFHW